MSEERRAILIIGGRGEFGQFLQQEILPHLCPGSISTCERETPREEYLASLERARHVILSTPLAGYAETACELVEDCRQLRETRTLWLIPSVQSEIWRAVRSKLLMSANSHLSAVIAHPMYGPQAFHTRDPTARNFQNILTARYEAAGHPLAEELGHIRRAFHQAFNIETREAFDPQEHDRINASSQGLSYCVARLMFEQTEIEELVREHLPEMHQSFRANRELILDFINLNTYMPQVVSAFTNAWRHTAQTTLADLLRAFAQADRTLNSGVASRIPTKWYEQLRAASQES
jgi:prephenate dehydrogenase